MKINNTMKNRTKYDVETGLTHAYVDCGNTVKDMLLSDNEVKIWEKQNVDSPDKIAAVDKKLEFLNHTAIRNNNICYNQAIESIGRQDPDLLLDPDSENGQYYNSLSEYGARLYKKDYPEDDWFLNGIGNVQVDSTTGKDAPSFRQMAILTNSNMLWEKIGERNSKHWNRMFFLAPLTAFQDYMTQVSWAMFGRLSNDRFTRALETFGRSIYALLFLPAVWFMFCLWTITFPIRMIYKFARPYYHRELSLQYLDYRYKSTAIMVFLLITTIISALYFTPVFSPLMDVLRSLDPFRDYVDTNIVNPYMNFLRSVEYSDIFKFMEIPFSTEGIRIFKVCISLPFTFICYPLLFNSIIFFGWMALLAYDTIKNVILPVFGNNDKARFNRRELVALSSHERLVVRRALFVINPDSIDRTFTFCLIGLIYSVICILPGINFLFVERIHRTAYKI